MCYFIGAKAAVCGPDGKNGYPAQVPTSAKDSSYCKQDSSNCQIRQYFMCAKVVGEWNDNISKLHRTWHETTLGLLPGVNEWTVDYDFKVMKYQGGGYYNAKYDEVA